MNFVIQFPLVSCYHLPFRSKYLSYHPFHEPPQLVSFPWCERAKFRIHRKQQAKVTVLYNVYGNSETLILNNLLQHVSAVKSHLLAEYKGVCIIQCHKMDEISLTKFEIIKSILLK